MPSLALAYHKDSSFVRLREALDGTVRRGAELKTPPRQDLTRTESSKLSPAKCASYCSRASARENSFWNSLV